MWKSRKFNLALFLQKFRETNVFTFKKLLHSSFDEFLWRDTVWKNVKFSLT